MFSRPWAWFWTAGITLRCTAAAVLEVLSLGLGVGWAVAAGVGAAALAGGYCTVNLVGPSAADAGDSEADSEGVSQIRGSETSG